MLRAGLRRLSAQPLSAGRLAALALLLQLPFALFGVHRASFDAYVHLFFADHYRQTWWQVWEPRWYLGFSVAAYPPLVHQLIALLAWPLEALITAFAPAPPSYPGEFRWLGAEAGYVLVLVTALALFPLAVRALARVFGGPRAADWAARLALLAPALYLTAWSFGQLPTLAATLLVLFALAQGAEFARTGRRRALVRAVALAAAAGATHHAVFLLVPAAGLAVAAQVLVTAGRPARRAILGRGLAWAALSAAAVAAVLWPFLVWSAGQSLQTPIDHASRHSFLQDPAATLFFFWPLAGPLLLLLPAALRLAWRAPRRRASLGAVWLMVFVLGLGGTTPLPRWLFGAGWEWLTYDRFGLWAALLFLPAAGAVLLGAIRRRAGWPPFLLGALAVTAGLAGTLNLLTRAQPPAVDLAPLVRFLNEPAQRPYRYLTLGFGDQLARLSALTANGTPDGTYHTARQLPELRQSGLGALDMAVWSPAGPWAVYPFLNQPHRYGLRWVFSNHPAYAPVLRAAGWTYRFEVGAVQAWERADVQPRPVPAPAEDRWAALWWGIAPLASLFAALLAGAWPLRLAALPWLAVLVILRRALLTLTLILAGSGWAAVVRAGPGDLPHIYLGYQSLLLFASDLALAAALLVWGIERIRRRAPLDLGPPLVRWAGLALVGATLLSIGGSIDPALSAWTAARLSLVAGLYLLWLNDPLDADGFGPLTAGLVLLQTAAALVEVVTQSTGFLAGWQLRWPGTLTAETRGASVVLAADGRRWLRAYGTFAHPNLLGGVLLVYLSGLVERYLSAGRRGWLVVISLALLTLGLTFSRAAWLGAAAGALLLARWGPAPARVRLRAVVAAAAVTAGLLALFLAPFWLSRWGLAGPNALEHASTLERGLLLGYGLDAWRAAPFTGVGAGGFVQWAARYLNAGLPFEPVHNGLILILAETGLFGAGAALALAGAVAGRVWRRRLMWGSSEALWAAALAALAVVSVFDHLWWTQPPAQLLASVVLANWARASRTRIP
ncbi:MAG: O-antigen ligase family protein [Anaerolineales bacterium]|nr:O-antigen ligase family protein [Anaerolineales bacterium]